MAVWMDCGPSRLPESPYTLGETCLTLANDSVNSFRMLPLLASTAGV